jgi:hypothetical protein
LLTEHKLDDKKPPELLQEMRSLVSHDIYEDILHSLWIEREPISGQWVLSASKGELTNLVEISDRILEHNRQSEVMATDNTHSEQLNSSQRHAVCFSDEIFANVEEQISKHR